MPRELGEALKSRTDRFHPFDHVTLSYEVHSVKPEPAIYQHCLKGLGTTAERTIFFDDRIANVHGAELLGIHAIEFLDRDDVLLAMRA
jgi:putative hydrolase of the HAD superfamily